MLQLLEAYAAKLPFCLHRRGAGCTMLSRLGSAVITHGCLCGRSSNRSSPAPVKWSISEIALFLAGSIINITGVYHIRTCARVVPYHLYNVFADCFLSFTKKKRLNFSSRLSYQAMHTITVQQPVLLYFHSKMIHLHGQLLWIRNLQNAIHVDRGKNIT